MSRTALLDALKTFDVNRIRTLLRREPELKAWRDEKGLNLLQISPLTSLRSGLPALGR